ncbi:Histone-lysine N-methyltransferase [Quillaja saponaria]|uniref:Histone-lysine N-methyltransferase n=1 Tax=Quillaja saponaria TaxID=32244 RepID=A0AAD7L0I6_QUISA|nr:Histone-lysine N-methyltransferase [Quillaja saponaria]
MAFHVACPITCRRICFCKLGFPRTLQSTKAQEEFLEEVVKIEEFLKDPLGIRAREKDQTVQVVVPKIVPPPPQLQPVIDGVVGGDGVDEAVSAQTKRVALQRKAAAAMVAAEDYARRFESGDLVDASRTLTGEDQGQPNAKVMCRMCFFGENEGSERANKMLSCKNCGKKYHRSCLKNWAQHRDLFHWSSWTCPSCRICEVCRRTGDPNKFMFCKRCDGAYHCYCQQPPHKNVSSGPYLCPKHTRCHSCGSNVPGNGLSVRWFLGYTCCDACGRLFVKGNYCPVCLKVYRDSESTPMVCCDICQRWVHCQCDGISDEKYLQFQVDGNLQYKCATCRGECYQVKGLEDAVQELWRRRDIADQNLISSLRAAAGLPTQEEIFSISPYSDDDDNGPVMSKNEFGRSVKFSLKGFVDKSPKKTKDFGKKNSNKKYSKKKEYQAVPPSIEGNSDTKSLYSMGNDNIDDMESQKNEGSDMCSLAVGGIMSKTEGVFSINQPGSLKHKFVDEVMVSDEDRNPRVVRVKSKKVHGLDSEEEIGEHGNKSKTGKGRKLVINFGPRKINVTNSPRSDSSSCQREQDVPPNGTEDISQTMGDKFMFDKHDEVVKPVDGKGDGVHNSGQLKGLKVAGREGNLIKLGKVRQEVSDLNPNSGRGNIADGYDSAPLDVGKRSSLGTTNAVAPVEKPAFRGQRTILEKQSDGGSGGYRETSDNSHQTPFSNYVPKDSKPSLKVKFKKPSIENQNSHQEEERSSIKGQRSKRKRPSHQDNLMDDIMDARILMKLGKDAVGKRVELNQPSDNSWHQGLVTDIIEGTSKVSVTLDDGKLKTLELGKQGVRLLPQKQKRSKT